MKYISKKPEVLVSTTTYNGKITDVKLSLGLYFGLRTIGHIDKDLIKQIIFWLECYSKGETPAFSLPLHEPFYPPFYSLVISFLKKIPFGKTYSYQEISQHLGKPQSARAVGNACKYNIFPLFIPCHRIIAKNNIGGFNQDLEIKRRLLLYEE